MILEDSLQIFGSSEQIEQQIKLTYEFLESFPNYPLKVTITPQ